MNARFAILALSATLASTVSRPTSVSDRVSLDRRPRAIRVLVLTDMEGISGIDDPRMTDSSPRYAAYYERGRATLHQDVNACISGLFDGGATAIDVVDGHGNGHNLQAAHLDPRVTLLSQDARRDLYSDLPKEGKYDAVVAVGMHDKPLSGGFMAHTRGAGLSPVLNGATLTETELVGYEFGMSDVPVIFVSGDDHLQRDLSRSMPWLVYVAVKKGTGYSTAELRLANSVREELRSGARSAMESLSRMKPLKPTAPIRAGMLATFPQQLPPPGSPFSRLPGIEYRGDTVTFPARDYPEAYERMGVLMNIAVRGGNQLMLNLLRARSDVGAPLDAVSDSVFYQLLPAFEAGTWRPGMPAPASRKPE